MMEKGGKIMVQKMIITTDGSHAAEKAAAFGLDHAAQINCKVVCITVLRPIESIIGMKLEYIFVEEKDSVAKELLAAGENAVARIVEKGREKGIDIEGRVVRGERVEKAICEAAREEGADMIVIGMHGQGFSGLATPEMGSVTRRLISVPPPCPVVVVPPNV